MTSAVQTTAANIVEQEIDVTADAAIGMPARTAATVHLPPASALSSPPVVCFAFPGGGYSRRYYTHDLRAAAPGRPAGTLPADGSSSPATPSASATPPRLAAMS